MHTGPLGVSSTGVALIKASKAERMKSVEAMAVSPACDKYSRSHGFMLPGPCDADEGARPHDPVCGPTEVQRNSTDIIY